MRLEEDFLPPFRRDDFLAAEDFRAPARFRPPFRPPLLRPEDPDRDRFLPLFRLDFLAAAIGKLRVGGFVERVARFARDNGEGATIRRGNYF